MCSRKLASNRMGVNLKRNRKNCVFVMLSLRIKLSYANRLYGPKSSQRAVLLRFPSHLGNLIFDLTQLLAIGECLLCDFSMVVDYIYTYWRLILRKVKKKIRMALFTINGPV